MELAEIQLIHERYEQDYAAYVRKLLSRQQKPPQPSANRDI